MKQIYSLLIILSASILVKAQIPMLPAPVPDSSNNCTTNSTIDVFALASNIIVGTHSRQSTSVEFKVVDITGNTVLRQVNKVYDGNNSITIDNLDKLRPGTYILQMMNAGESSIAKFSVTR